MAGFENIRIMADQGENGVVFKSGTIGNTTVKFNGTEGATDYNKCVIDGLKILSIMKPAPATDTKYENLNDILKAIGVVNENSNNYGNLLKTLEARLKEVQANPADKPADKPEDKTAEAAKAAQAQAQATAAEAAEAAEEQAATAAQAITATTQAITATTQAIKAESEATTAESEASGIIETFVNLP